MAILHDSTRGSHRRRRTSVFLLWVAAASVAALLLAQQQPAPARERDPLAQTPPDEVRLVLSEAGLKRIAVATPAILPPPTDGFPPKPVSRRAQSRF